ncbi:MAG: hypothetical protein BWY20_02473 [Spirochaetes bacterium ADurb.Bin215]|nr:MAG: hypothetical protein BWY20_02473 [Spirochaetes bacterium ADurb.Bin215]
MQVQIGDSIPGKGYEKVFPFFVQGRCTLYGDDIGKFVSFRIDRDQLNFVHSGFERYHERSILFFRKSYTISLVNIPGGFHPQKLVVYPCVDQRPFKRGHGSRDSY